MCNGAMDVCANVSVQWMQYSEKNCIFIVAAAAADFLFVVIVVVWAHDSEVEAHITYWRRTSSVCLGAVEKDSGHWTIDVSAMRMVFVWPRTNMSTEDIFASFIAPCIPCTKCCVMLNKMADRLVTIMNPKARK